jgi:Zn-finger nucleic acid-binding protein
MKCPIDGTELVQKPYEADINVDACPTCQGMWLDKGEREAIEQNKEHKYTEELARMPDLGYNAYELAQQKAQRTLTCPNCSAEMEKREYARCSQIMIDVCPKCHGTWLDKGEIEALEIFFERSHLETDQIRRAFFADLRDLFKT